MPGYFFEAGALYTVALKAAKSILAESRVGGQMEALTSIVFSVVSLEALLNEVWEMAANSRNNPDEPEIVRVFYELMKDSERASLESKFLLSNWVLTNGKFDTSAQPYQDFCSLISLRNDLVHFKPNESFTVFMIGPEAKPDSQYNRKRLARLEAKNILALNPNVSISSWTFAITTKAVAEWSCEVASQMATDFADKAAQFGMWGQSVKQVLMTFKTE